MTLLICLCRPSGKSALLPPFFQSGDWSLHADFDRISLDPCPKCNPANATQADSKFAAINSSNFPLRENYPDARENDLRPCIFALSRFYQSYERGLRLRVCGNPGDFSATEINALLKKFRGTDLQFYPRYESAGLLIRKTTPAEIRRNGPYLAVVDGTKKYGEEFIAGTIRGTEINLRYRLNPLTENQDVLELPRIFPGAEFHLLVNEAGFSALYYLPNRNKILEIRFRSELLSSLLMRHLRELRIRILRKNENAALVNSRISEISLEYGKLDKGYVEIASDPAKDGIISYSIRGKNGIEILYRGFSFASSTHLYAIRDLLPRARIDFSDRMGAGQQSYLRTDLESNGISKYRAGEIIQAGENPAPAFRCFSLSPCGSKGLHPDFIKKIGAFAASSAGDKEFCTIEDFRLRELNPFGIVADQYGSSLSSNRLDPYGKFIEFELLRNCKPGRVLFKVGITILDPGFEPKAKANILLFIASRKYFANSAFIENSNLRRIKPRDVVQVLELPTGMSRVLRTAPPVGTEYIYGNKYLPRFAEGSTSPIFRRVHSLVYLSRGGIEQEGFHAHHSMGLRPDIKSVHAMSPGFATDRSFVDSPLIALAEIFPEGSRNSTGFRQPADEFIELRIARAKTTGIAPSETGSDGRFSLLIRPLRSGSDRRYDFPIPLLGTELSRRFYFIRKTSLCFGFSPISVPYSNLFLPNGPASYEVQSMSGLSLDQYNLDAQIYDAMRLAQVATSVSRIFPDTPWQLTSSSTSHANQCDAGLATPGYASIPP